MKTFNLEDALKGAPICDGKGKPARILATNLKGDYPICVAISNADYENTILINDKGEELVGANSIRMVECWEPKGGSVYINSRGQVKNGGSSKEAREFGMQRNKTFLAESALEGIREFTRLQAYVDEALGEDYLFYEHTTRYFIWLDGKGNYSVGSTTEDRTTLCTVYMPEAVAINLAEGLNDGSIKL